MSEKAQFIIYDEKGGIERTTETKPRDDQPAMKVEKPARLVLKEHEARIAQLEAQLAALEARLAAKNPP